MMPAALLEVYAAKRGFMTGTYLIEGAIFQGLTYNILGITRGHFRTEVDRRVRCGEYRLESYVLDTVYYND
jgi:hypothetical protein